MQEYRLVCPTCGPDRGLTVYVDENKNVVRAICVECKTVYRFGEKPPERWVERIPEGRMIAIRSILL